MKDYLLLSKKFQALSHPVRLRMIEGMMSSDCCVGEVQSCLGISQPNVSQHLKILKDAGIIEGRREKNRICYYIKDNLIKKIIKEV